MFSEEQCDGPHGETSSLLDGGNNNITRIGTDNPDGGRIVSLLPYIQVLYDFMNVLNLFSAMMCGYLIISIIYTHLHYVGVTLL